ncbi:tousled-like protein kinase [Gorgonomyces haynaldii]|nr:tousled-like protein kinase [Gorgonomyces haynaldii]
MRKLSEDKTPQSKKMTDFFKPKFKSPAIDRDLREENAVLRQELEVMQEKMQQDKRDLEHDLQEWMRKCQFLETKTLERAKKTCVVLVEILREQSKYKRRELRRKLAEDSLRLAHLTNERRGMEFVDCWQEGYQFQDINQQLSLIQRQKEEAMQKKKKKLDLLEDEIIKLQLAALKKEETDLLQKLERTNVEREMHIKLLRRARDEDQSRFNNNPVMNERYLLLELIGKGGFSEVYKAFDLIELKEVACKIHSLSNQWSAEKKQSYTKHSIREYHIHQSLEHPHIVKLFDVFEYDQYSFCTILEYVPGLDLESHLQTWKLIPEKEARHILVQMISALKYLNTLDNPIIHYDLKPGNLLLHNGCVKLTDFGLSKIVNQDTLRETNLTSQGAGTYWYLPPEVFERSEDPIKISSKVDVWSVGCIVYEMLYGQKPFGNNRSQFSILKESVIAKDGQFVVFPLKPLVSQECKDFIKRCLQYRKQDRPTILELCEDPYVKPKK